MRKKYLFGILAIVFVMILTGCGSEKKENKVECSLSYNNQSQVLTAEYDKDGIITKISAQFVYENSENAKNDLDRIKITYGESATLDGNKINVSNLKGQKVYEDMVGKPKDEFRKYLDLQIPLDSLIELSCK